MYTDKTVSIQKEHSSHCSGWFDLEAKTTWSTGKPDFREKALVLYTLRRRKMKNIILIIINANFFIVSDIRLCDENEAESMRQLCGEGRKKQVSEQQE
jgi:hypothetical protein